jgi:leucyl aminopeptidase
MKFFVNDENPIEHVCRVLVLGCFEDNEHDPFFTLLDEQLGGYMSALYKRKEFTGSLNKVKMVQTLGRIAPESILLMGLGKKKELTVEKVRQASGTAVQSLRQPGIKSFSALVPGNVENAKAAAEGFALGGYSFNCYKTKQDELNGIEQVTILSGNQFERSAAEKAIEETTAVCDAVCFARDLVTQPGNVATPSYLAEKALEVSGKYNLTCTVWEREEMERHSMEALLAVARGSHQPPRFISLEYHSGEAKERPIVLVGKGITFDSGGLSLKPREGMEKMKTDMAGAAAVMGTLMAVAALKLPLHVVGLIPAAENLPGGSACKPGDIIRSMSGQTIEIVNTDAEGRLILCDTLHYAQSFRPAALIDLATLTGACVVALGGFATGLLGNDERLKNSLKKAGEATGERVWELPLWDEYGELMKSDIADLKNSGGPSAGTISAAWFLKSFIGNTRWAHLDIAGTAWEEKGRHYLPKGATGTGVRLLVEYLKDSLKKK